MPRNESKFWDRLARRYSRQPIADEAAYARWLSQLVRPQISGTPDPADD